MSDVWPVAFVGWKSKGSEMLEQVRQGQMEVWTGKLHLRKGAQFVALLEDGTLLGAGEVSGVQQKMHHLSIKVLATSLDNAPKLSTELLEALRGVPRPFLKQPVNALIIMPGKQDGILTETWFQAAELEAQQALTNTAHQIPSPIQTAPPAQVMPSPAPAKEPAAPAPVAQPVPQEPATEREALLKSWVPPALQGLLQDHVRADQWEVIVAYAFQALGCQVKSQGRGEPGKAVPDCIARYTSPAGQLIELIIDAKAGTWNGAVDDIRAMRDYLALSNPYSFPLFVANGLKEDVRQRLNEHIMHGKVAKAITGRDLAVLIMQRFTDPNFNVEMELRRLFLV